MRLVYDGRWVSVVTRLIKIMVRQKQFLDVGAKGFLMHDLASIAGHCAEELTFPHMPKKAGGMGSYIDLGSCVLPYPDNCF